VGRRIWGPRVGLSIRRVRGIKGFCEGRMVLWKASGRGKLECI
jgi:hypothetical protein